MAPLYRSRGERSGAAAVASCSGSGDAPATHDRRLLSSHRLRARAQLNVFVLQTRLRLDRIVQVGCKLPRAITHLVIS